jgi:carbon-monoxide dehydrogenase large subunit
LIEGIDTAAARAMPGVSGVFTAAHLDADGVGTLPCIARVATVAPMIVPPRRALARDRARHVGDPVAFVVADTVQQARDAAERVAVTYRPRPAVVDAKAALAAEAPFYGTKRRAICRTGLSAATDRGSMRRSRQQPRS